MQDQKFTATDCGPRQLSKVQKALGSLKFQQGSHVEVTGIEGQPDTHRRTLLTAMFSAEVKNPTALAQLAAVGERFGWQVTKANASALAKALETAAIVAKEAAPEVLNLTKPETIKARAVENAERDVKRDAHQAEARAAWQTVVDQRPPNATALIVAELDRDTGDIMTDYHAHTTTRQVAIGWRTGQRESFPQLRKAAATFEPTSNLGPGCNVWTVEANRDDVDTVRRGELLRLDGGGVAVFHTEAQAQEFLAQGLKSEPEAQPDYVGACGFWYHAARFGVEFIRDSVEHRENYSMGAGNYLKHGGRDSTGWGVKSVPIPSNLDGHFSYVIEDALPKAAPTPDGAPRTGDGYTITARENKRAPFHLVELADRVERAEFERLRSSAKSAGGWYSRKWGKCPAGFGFPTVEAAESWARAEFGADDCAPVHAKPEPEPLTAAEVSTNSPELVERMRNGRTYPAPLAPEPDPMTDGPAYVQLGENLRQRLTAYAVISCKSPASDSYCRELGELSGFVVKVERTWFGPVPQQPELRGQPALPYAYNIEAPSGKLYHLPCLFAEPCDPPEPLTPAEVSTNSPELVERMRKGRPKGSAPAPYPMTLSNEQAAAAATTDAEAPHGWLVVGYAGPENRGAQVFVGFGCGMTRDKKKAKVYPDSAQALDALWEHEKTYLEPKSWACVPVEPEPTPDPDTVSTNPAHCAREREAQRLEGLADTIQKSIDHKRAPLTQNPTPRRLGIKEGQHADADRLEQVQEALRALAAAQRTNTIPSDLVGFGSRGRVEELLHGHSHSRQHLRQREALQALVKARGLSGDTRREELRAEHEKAAELDSLRWQKIPGFYPTPHAAAERLVELLDVQAGNTVLEPSAGMGSLVDEILKLNVACRRIDVVERMPQLVEHLKRKYPVGPGQPVRVLSEDFEKFEGRVGDYDRIAMNPPFEKGVGWQHVARAAKMLAPGGRLVAILPPTQVQKALGARELIGLGFNAYGEPLPEGSFNGPDAFKRTGVSVELLVIERD